MMLPISSTNIRRERVEGEAVHQHVYKEYVRIVDIPLFYILLRRIIKIIKNHSFLINVYNCIDVVVARPCWLRMVVSLVFWKQRWLHPYRRSAREAGNHCMCEVSELSGAHTVVVVTFWDHPRLGSFFLSCILWEPVHAGNLKEGYCILDTVHCLLYTVY